MKKPRRIEISGVAYRVIENLGFVHDVGMNVVEVKTARGPAKAVKDGGSWRFWSSVDRTTPLRLQEREKTA